MADVSVYDTGNGLSALLDRVERGEEVVITRRGKAVARLVPAGPPDRPRAAVAGLRALRADLANRGVSFTSTELQAMRDEGRR